MDDAAPRLDTWLWFARFAKTRTQAQALCAAGHVRLNGMAVRRGHRRVHAGDTVDVLLGLVWRFVTVAAIGARRGPAAEARGLYTESQPPIRLNPADDRPVAECAFTTAPPDRREGAFQVPPVPDIHEWNQADGG